MTSAIVQNTPRTVPVDKPANRYFVKKQDDLYFVMERFNQQNADFWKLYISKQHGKALELRENCPYKTLEAIRTGTLGFREIMVWHEIHLEKSPHELWMLFACRVLPQEGESPDFESLEMTCTVSTSPKAPFTTHMGIFRTINSNLLNQRIHSNISVPLHAFGAKIMKQLHPEKVYMITTPMPHMEEIFRRTLGKANIHIALEEEWSKIIEKEQQKIDRSLQTTDIGGMEQNGDTRDEIKYATKTVQYFKNRIAASDSQVVIGRNESSFTLNDLDGKPLLSLDKEQMYGDYKWYFGRSTTFSGRNNMIAIPLQQLAEYEPSSES